jgi:glyoxylase-like metal-dependent hydrolase (beta-lactamase superfamily II)
MKLTYSIGRVRIILSIFCLFLLGWVLSAQEADFNKLTDTRFYDVSGSVVMVRHPYGSNITCIAMDEGLVFVDCGMKTEFVAEFRKKMEKKYNKKTIALLLTHVHIDHFLGMAAFNDVKVVAAEAGKNLFNRQLAIEFNDQRIEAYTKIFPKFRESIGTAKPFLPNTWVKDEMTFGSPKGGVIFRNTGGHSSCSSNIYFKKEGILVAGDLIQADQYVYFGDPTTSLSKWIDTLKKWETMNIVKICPGHGRVVDRSYLKQVWTFFERMISAVKKLKADQVPIEKVVNHPSLPKGYWPQNIEKPRWWNYCISSLYQKI